MQAQRLIMPDGRVSWTALHDGVRVSIVRDFVIYLEARDFAPKTVEAYTRAIVKLGNYIGNTIGGFSTLTAGELDQFLLATSRKNPVSDLVSALRIIQIKPERASISRSRFNQTLAAVKRFYGFFDHTQATSLFGENNSATGSYTPFLGHLGRRPQRRDAGTLHSIPTGEAQAVRAATRRLTPDQVASIIEAARTLRDAFLVMLLYVSGMRISEARGLHHKDFDLGANTIWIVHREDLENGARVKNRKSRAVVVPGYVMRMYEDYVASDEYLEAFEAGSSFVFCNVKGGRRGRGLTASAVQEIKDAIAARSKVDFTWHMFRHTHASEIIASGYSLMDAAERLGHSDPQTTNTIYKHLFDTEHKKLTLKTHTELEDRLMKSNGRKSLIGSKIPWL